MSNRLPLRLPTELKGSPCLSKAWTAFDLKWVGDVTYGDVFMQNEVEFSKFNFESSDADTLFTLFDLYESEAKRLIEAGLVLPGYDFVLKCSHTFNLLDARGAISVSERTRFIGRVRALARMAAQGYLAERERLGFPMLKRGRE